MIIDDKLRLSDADGRLVDEAVARGRRAAGEALADDRKAREGKLADLDANAYERLVTAVAKETAQLRRVLEAAEAKEKERVWRRLQTTGDLDDSRLVDGATGDVNVYRRRAQADEHGLLQRHPKRLLFAVDVSASMAMFDDEDRRLARAAAAVVMFMEALSGFEHKYDYSLRGHNGDTDSVDFVAFGRPPKSMEARFEVIRALYGATACRSGDHTLAAAERAVFEIAQEPADDYLVLLLSDANVQQYGITADALDTALGADGRVSAHAVFVAPGAAAEALVRGMKPGRGHIVLDPAQLPALFSNIFKQSLARL